MFLLRITPQKQGTWSLICTSQEMISQNQEQDILEMPVSVFDVDVAVLQIYTGLILQRKEKYVMGILLPIYFLLNCLQFFT